MEFHFNEKGLIKNVKDKKNPINNKDFYYDQYKRLITAYGPWGKIRYRYDSMDNFLLREENSNKLRATYYKKSSKIKELAQNGKSVEVKYDKLGRMVKCGNMSFAYNERGRLSKVLKNDQLKVELFYNSKGQRIIEKRGDRKYYYVYDKKDRLLSKHDNHGKVLKEYVYKKDVPIGFMKENRMYYYHYDLMNFPIMISDESGNVVRNAQYKPYGQIYSIKGDLNDMLRFPGQFEISGLKLYYNLYRTYNPILLRYIEPDPLLSNQNIYQYSGCNPILFGDLKGLLRQKNSYILDIFMFSVDVWDFFDPSVEVPGAKDYEGFLGLQGKAFLVCAQSECYKKKGKKGHYKKCGWLMWAGIGIGTHNTTPGTSNQLCWNITVSTKKSPSKYDPPSLYELKGKVVIKYGGLNIKIPRPKFMIPTHWDPSVGSAIIGDTETSGITFRCLGIGKVKGWFGVTVEAAFFVGKSYIIGKEHEPCCEKRCCLTKK